MVIEWHTFQSGARVCCKLRILKEKHTIIHVLNWPVSKMTFYWLSSEIHVLMPQLFSVNVFLFFFAKNVVKPLSNQSRKNMFFFSTNPGPQSYRNLCTFSRAWQRLSVFPRLALVSRFPALGACCVSAFSCDWLTVIAALSVWPDAINLVSVSQQTFLNVPPFLLRYQNKTKLKACFFGKKRFPQTLGGM